jgi:hypothetical protein
LLALVLTLAHCAPAGAAEREILFSGHRFRIKDTGPSRAGPGPNRYSAENVRVDEQGRLHLRVARDKDGGYSCAEVISVRSFGYGTYRFHMASSVGSLDPNVVLGLFTYSEESARNHREIDIEIARWGSRAGPNLHFVVQPYAAAGNAQKNFLSDAAPASVHSLTWLPHSVSFLSVEGPEVWPGAPVIAEFSYGGSDVPPAGGEKARLNLWLYQGRPPASGRPIEVIVDRFVFEPMH